ncbi:MAG: hypothetical protein HC892_00350 [Saprospiraceae bacterium]|nr:hypothetical protein [Saprospiraceae bacterium]
MGIGGMIGVVTVSAAVSLTVGCAVSPTVVRVAVGVRVSVTVIWLVGVRVLVGLASFPAWNTGATQVTKHASTVL